jgi:amidase
MSITFEQSGAFVERFTLPPTRSGPLDGLTFAVKDIIDVAGHHTGCGNPTWRATHPLATVSAVCVEQLLSAGARCEGKTITDEIAFSLLGENHFYGTPLNPKAHDRVPGGSSSGSASAVACGLVDFAIGTDTGGSVRTPASNCGIFGIRPSHGIISVAGVMPLAPTLDTVGLFARDIDTLERAASVLLPDADAGSPDRWPRRVHFVTEAFALADEQVRDAVAPAVESVREVFDSASLVESSLEYLCSDARAADPKTWLTLYRVLQGTESMSCLGDWIATSAAAFGPACSAGLEFIKKIDRTRIGESVELRELLYQRLNASLAPYDLLCFPSKPTIAPLKGSKAYERTNDYYQRTLALNGIAGIARLPQVSLPLGHVGGAPIGLSLATMHGADRYLIELAKLVVQLHAARGG